MTEAEDVDRDAAVDDAARLVARARKVLANGELAMSARPLLFGEDGVYPQFVAEAKGCRFTDTTGRAYIDWVVGWESALDAGVSELVFVLTRNGPAPRHIRFPSDVPRLEPGPPVSFRFHEPSIEDLEARLAEARRLESMGSEEAAAAMTDSIRQNLQRFFPAVGDRPERQRRLLEDLERRG